MTDKDPLVNENSIDGNLIIKMIDNVLASLYSKKLDIIDDSDDNEETIHNTEQNRNSEQNRNTEQNHNDVEGLYNLYLTHNINKDNINTNGSVLKKSPLDKKFILYCLDSLDLDEEEKIYKIYSFIFEELGIFDEDEDIDMMDSDLIDFENFIDDEQKEIINNIKKIMTEYFLIGHTDESFIEE